METSMAMLLEPKVLFVPLFINLVISTLMGMMATTKWKIKEGRRVYAYRFLVIILASGSAFYNAKYDDLISESIYMDIGLWVFLSVIIYDYGFEKLEKMFRDKIINKMLGISSVKG